MVDHDDVMGEMKKIVTRVFPYGTFIERVNQCKYNPHLSKGVFYEWDIQLREYIAVDLYRFYILWHNMQMSKDEVILTIVKSLELIGISNLDIMRLFEEFYNTKFDETELRNS